MVNPRLAGRYAKSLLDIAIEKDQVEAIKADVGFLVAAVKSSNEFRALLRSPIVKGEKKQAILNAICNGKVGAITLAFIKLLVSKGREKVLPEILDAFGDQYNELKGINKVKLSTAQPVSEELKSAIVSKIKAETGLEQIELETAVNADLIGGFVLEFNNNLVDVSVQRDLRDIKRQFLKNDYIFKLQ